MSLDVPPEIAAVVAPARRKKRAAEDLLASARECGAADAGLVSIDDPGIAEERPYILRAFSDARAARENWIRFLNEEISILRCLATRAVRLKGPPRLWLAFGKCFPSCWSSGAREPRSPL